MLKLRVKTSYVVIAIVIFVIFLPGYAKFMELRFKNIYLEREIERLEEENIKLYNETKKLQEDVDYMEKVARESMGVTRKGEIPIFIERQQKR